MGESDIGIDRQLVGAWSGREGNQGKIERMVVLPFSDHGYLIHYPADDKGIYYRGYLIEMSGSKLIQLQALGTHQGLPEKIETPYTLASWSLVGDKFSIRMIDKDAIDTGIKDSATLRKAFVRHKADKGLFGDAFEFQRLKDEE